MGIEMHQIHNVVRTYQHALQPSAPANPTGSVNRQDDREFFFTQARERHYSEPALPEQDRDTKKRTR